MAYYIPTTEAQLATAATDYRTATLADRRAFESWCLAQLNGAAPFNDHSWLAWRAATTKNDRR